MLSKNVFCDWFNKEVQPRWKTHHFEWIETGDWHWRLRDFEIDTLTQAVRQHKACECYPMPNLKKVYEYAKTIQTHNSPQPAATAKKPSSGIPDTHTFIMCTVKDDRGRGCVGWFVDILICPLNKTYSAETYQRVAAEQAERHRSTCGGQWKIFTNTTHGEMMNRRMKLRNTKPLDLTQLRKLYTSTCGS
jgi:hypothetical protein